MNLVKIVIEIAIADGLGGKLVAKTMEKAIMASLKASTNHPAIKNITSRIE